ncbi:MAG: insulinase family protein [Cyanobacteria bacterium Co-bin13]|nr:insulinase family protein [Cyanobacteria bacterium Co-bin13]
MVTENPVADIVSARIFLRAGSSYESPEQAGLFSLLMALLTKGTARLSSLEIAEAVESIGASLGSDASADYSLVSLKTVSADFPAMLKLAGEVLRHPSFPEAEVSLERRLTLQQIRSMQEQPFTVAYNHLRESMYQNHPYGLPGIGTEASVAALTREHLAQAHRQYFRPDNTVISIVGRIDPAQALGLVEEVFGDWPTPPEPLLEPQFPPVPVEGMRQAIPQETNQSIVMVGYLAAPVKHPAYPALKLINTYLGNGLSSRLFVEMREKRGLAYDVSAIYPTRLGLSQFVVYMGTAPENTPVALEGLRHEVERLCETLLTEEELQATKNKLLGQYALGKQTNAQIAQLNGWYEVLGLGTDFDQRFQTAIAAITAADIRLVAQEFFNQPYITLLGPASAIQ